MDRMGLPARVTFDATGDARTGNKLIQYLACKIICHVFGHTYTGLVEEVEDTIVIDDENFATILAEKPYYLRYTNIRLKGYFQKSSLLVPYRKELLAIMYDPTNYDFWILKNKDILYVRSLVKDVATVPIDPTDLCMSLRLDDFMHNPWYPKSDVPYPSYYTDILKRLEGTFDKLYIICDTVRHEWEWEYIRNFMPWNPILLQESFAHDCCLLRTAPRLIHSNSSLCWIMSFLAEGAKERYIPNTRFYDAQTLEKIEESDEVFYPATMEHAELDPFSSR